MERVVLIYFFFFYFVSLFFARSLPFLRHLRSFKTARFKVAVYRFCKSFASIEENFVIPTLPEMNSTLASFVVANENFRRTFGVASIVVPFAVCVLLCNTCALMAKEHRQLLGGTNPIRRYRRQKVKGFETHRGNSGVGKIAFWQQQGLSQKDGLKYRNKLLYASVALMTFNGCSKCIEPE